jgi:RND family efflux transporter MFP subunit
MWRFLSGLAIGLCAAAAVLAWSLRHKHDDHGHDHAHEAPEPKSLQVTAWGGAVELFIEHALPVAGEEVKFVTHVTLAGAAVTDAVVRLEGERDGGIAAGMAEKTAAPGIFSVLTTFPTAGDWAVEMVVVADATEHRVALPPVKVHATPADAAKADVPEPAEGVRFLKEQQWKLGTRIEAAGRRKLVERLKVPGTVVAKPGARALVTPPVDGRLFAPKLPQPGERIEAGQVIGHVQPPFNEITAKALEADAAVVRAKLALDLSARTAERIRRLVSEKAKSERELHEAEHAVKAAQAEVAAAESIQASYRATGLVDGKFALVAPIGGIVTRVGAAAGEIVHADEAIVTILDARELLVEARVPEGALGRFAKAGGALVECPDAPGDAHDCAARLRFTSPEVDPVSRTVALIYDVSNPESRLRVGMGVTLHIETERVEDGVAVPAVAIVEEEGRTVVFVQAGGETFEKRDVECGVRDGGWVHVRTGLAEGERIVTKGAYAVRLASVSTSIPAHGHAH